VTSNETPFIDEESELSAEAAEWFLRIQDDVNAHRQGLLAWLARSQKHEQAYRQIERLHSVSLGFDPLMEIDVDALVSTGKARVIALPIAVVPDPPGDTQVPGKWRPVRIAVAVGVAVAAMAFTLLSLNSSKEYTTAIGEQRTAKLDDGSIVQLNTDTRITVTLSKTRRDIRLVRGEALFIVEHEPSRPFIVSAGTARVRVVGTSFNIRDRADTVDVTVLEGAVQVTANEALPDNQRSAPGDVAPVKAGENARVASGRVVTSPASDVVETLSWRERRLVFHEATLEDMAREFNRYNNSQIKVIGSVASRVLFKTATFSADRPQSLILYLSKDPSVSIEAVSDTWVIRDR